MICPYRPVYTVDKPRHVLVKLLPIYVWWTTSVSQLGYLSNTNTNYGDCSLHFITLVWVLVKKCYNFPIQLIGSESSKGPWWFDWFHRLHGFHHPFETRKGTFPPLAVTNLPVTGHHAALDSYGFASRASNRINAGSLANSRDAIDTWLDPLHP